MPSIFASSQQLLVRLDTLHPHTYQKTTWWSLFFFFSFFIGVYSRRSLVSFTSEKPGWIITTLAHAHEAEAARRERRERDETTIRNQMSSWGKRLDLIIRESIMSLKVQSAQSSLARKFTSVISLIEWNSIQPNNSNIALSFIFLSCILSHSLAAFLRCVYSYQASSSAWIPPWFHSRSRSVQLQQLRLS